MSTDPPAGFVPLPDVDGFITHVGPLYVRWTEASAQLGFRVAEHHANPAGICHGGMLMTLMDMGIAVALKVAAKSEMFLPTINLSFDFLAPANVGDWLVSEVSFTHTTPRMGFAHGLLIGPNGPVARANGIMKIPKADDARFMAASRRVGNLGQDG
ncbi:MAG: PaaI family thioesterase [Alphaproteobacteria bacterium]